MTSADQHRRTFIIIPAYNELGCIGDVLRSLHELGYMMVVVDDGSTTPLAVEVPKDPAIILLRHKVNLGQGAALQTGIDYALSKGATCIASFDADGQHSVHDLPSLLTPIYNDEVDIVLASRFMVKGDHNAPALKKIILKIGRWVNYLFTGLYLSDAHNGLRAMNRVAALTIRIEENRMAHATEILAQIKKHRLRYKEVAAKVLYTDYSRHKGQSYFNSLKILFDLVLQKLFR